MMSKQSPPQFKRVLTLGELVLFGITFVGPTAPFPVFGIVSSISRGHMALVYLIAMGGDAPDGAQLRPDGRGISSCWFCLQLCPVDVTSSGRIPDGMVDALRLFA